LSFVIYFNYKYIISYVGKEQDMYPFYETKKSESPYYFNIFKAMHLSFPPHLHSYVELIYVTEGSITVSVNEKVKALGRGEIAVCFPNDVHSYKTEASSEGLLLIFSPEIISGYFSRKMDKTLENPFLHEHNIDKTAASLLEMIHEEFLGSNNEYVIKGFLYAVFGRLSPYLTFKKGKRSYNNTIQSVLKYIEGHYYENINLDIMAKALGFSKYYLSRLFSDKIGYQFNDYVNRLRINMAQELLSETDMTIVNVALECGFESQRNFNRVFKSLLGLTPAQYRIQAKIR
jgi:AraC-like DNA-binding protein/mannose-6-phosphate isomerase-like protein (cupin superfamily)